MTSWKSIFEAVPYTHTHPTPLLTWGPHTLSVYPPLPSFCPHIPLLILLLCSFSTPRRNCTKSRSNRVEMANSTGQGVQPLPSAPPPAVPPAGHGTASLCLSLGLSSFQHLLLRLWVCDLVLWIPMIRRPPQASLPTLFHLCLESWRDRCAHSPTWRLCWPWWCHRDLKEMTMDHIHLPQRPIPASELLLKAS